MIKYFAQQETVSKPADIIPFPQQSMLSTSGTGTNLESLLVEALSNPAVETHLKGIVEGAITNAWVKTHYMDVGTLNDPFDAIYISELKADSVNQQDLGRIFNYSKIIDLSDTLSFDDEWED